MLKPTLNSVDTQFEALLQDLPLELVNSARAFRAFTRARKIKRRRRRKRQTLPAAVQSLLLLAGKAANTLSLEALAT